MKTKHISDIFTPLALVLSLILMLLLGETLSDSVRYSLSLVYVRVLPSLFPFMVVSSLIVSYDALVPLCKKIPFGRVLGIPEQYASVILTGLLCGFPTGASGTARLYSRGVTDVRGAGVLCAVSSFAAPSFLLGGVGATWGCRGYGVFLAVCGWTVNLAYCVLSSRRQVMPTTAQAVCAGVPRQSFAQCLCTAVSESAVSCLRVCAFICFFSCLSDALSQLFPPVSGIVCCVLEFSRGSMGGAASGGVFGAAMCGFSVGFTGICVLMQEYAILSPLGISMRPSFALALVRGTLLSVLSAFFFILHPMESSISTAVSETKIGTEGMIFVTILLFFAIISSKLLRDGNLFRERS